MGIPGFLFRRPCKYMSHSNPFEPRQRDAPPHCTFLFQFCFDPYQDNQCGLDILISHANGILGWTARRMPSCWSARWRRWWRRRVLQLTDAAAKTPKLLPRQVKVHSKCLNHEDERLCWGTIHILRNHIFRFFYPTLPTCVSMILVVIKNQNILYSDPPSLTPTSSDVIYEWSLGYLWCR